MATKAIAANANNHGHCDTAVRRRRRRTRIMIDGGALGVAIARNACGPLLLACHMHLPQNASISELVLSHDYPGTT